MINNKTRKILRYVLLYTLAVVGAAIMVLPFLFMISNSLKENVYVIEYPPQLIPANPSLGNFKEAWQANNFQLYFGNSAFVAIISTILTVLVSATTAYAFARFEFKGKEFLFFLVLVVLGVPDLVPISPIFMLVQS